jgi:hypothetical protein
MGKPGGARASSLVFERERTWGTETSQYPEEEKSTEMPVVAASEPGPSLNRLPCGDGVVGPTGAVSEVSRSPMEWGARDGESPVGQGDGLMVVEFLSNARYESPGVKLGGPPSKAKDSRVTDSGRVP